MNWEQHFRNTDGLMGIEDGRFLYALALIAGSSKRGKVAVEVGCWRGRSAIAIGQGCKDSGLKLITTDTWVGTVSSDKAANDRGCSRNQAVANIATAGLADVVEVVTGTALDLSQRLQPGSVAMTFIDGDHTYEGCKNDLLALWPYIPKGGYVAFHDTWGPPIIRVIDELIYDHGARFVGGVVTLRAFQKVTD